MKRVFLSFRAEDRTKVTGLRLLATNPDFDIEFDEESARVPYDSDAAAAVRRRVGEKIARASVTVCLVSAETHTCPWVTWELEQSIGEGNAIVCMGFRDGPKELVLPEPVRRLNIGWWGWNYMKLAELIAEAP